MSKHYNKAEIGGDDPVISKLAKTGCLDKHYAVLECMNDKKDWRKCQQEVHSRDCMVTYEKSKADQKTIDNL